jgi:hypothetical protein
MADQNQGASIEAERAACLEIVKELGWSVNGTWVVTKSGDQLHTLDALAFARAARRTPPTAAAGEVELPPLPKACQYVIEAGWGYTAEQYQQGQREAIAHYQRKQASQVGGAPAAKAGSYASTAADWAEDFAQENGNYENRCADCGIGFMGHKRRTICKVCAGATLQEIIDIGQEIEAGAAPSVKTWQERANELAVSGRPRGYPDTDELEALKDAEIADLRAQLAAKGQGEPVAKVVRGGSEFGPSLAFIANGKDFPKVGSLLYLAAPASAQPTDRCEHGVWAADHCYQCNGAQPDQRESAAVPKGWKFVPPEPTQAMCDAGRARALDWENSGEPWSAMTWFRIYKSMLAAAPFPAAKPVAKDEQSNADKFCDANCVWTNHAPGCFRAEGEQPTNNKGEN